MTPTDLEVRVRHLEALCRELVRRLLAVETSVGQGLQFLGQARASGNVNGN